MGTERYRRVRFQSCGTVGCGPTLNKKGGDILCDQVARYVREQLVSYVGNNVGTKGKGQREPFSCSLRRGGQIGKVLILVVTEMLSTIVTGFSDGVVN